MKSFMILVVSVIVINLFYIGKYIEYMNETPEIIFTVLLPVYNNKEDVLNAIKSIINQTCKSWELIIIDDCSTDDTYEIIKDYLKTIRSEQIILLRNERNKGTYVSINEGLLKARGKYIARIDSDDIVANIFLEEHLNVFNQDPEKYLITQSKYSRNGSTPQYGEITLIYHRKIIDKIGFYDSLRFAADTEFWHRIIKYYGNNNIIKINKPLYFAQKRPNSLTTSSTTGFSPEGRKIRQDYVNKFTEWHKQNDIYMTYPLIKRPFEVNQIMLP